jgi:hypothetical protein
MPDTNAKVWKTSRTSSAGFVVTDTEALVVGNENNVIAVNEQGVTIAGPISLVADAANIRRGGLFTGLNDFTDMIPSTIVTPIPKQIPSPPITGLMNIKQDVAYFMSLLV